MIYVMLVWMYVFGAFYYYVADMVPGHQIYTIIKAVFWPIVGPILLALVAAVVVRDLKEERRLKRKKKFERGY